MREVAFRFGMVLGPGGALHEMLPIFKKGVGGVLGSGKQWVSWIHVEDLIEMLVLALKDVRYRGVVNAVSPQAVTNREFTHALGHSLHRPTFARVPAFALKLALGEMSSVLLTSQRVEPTKLRQNS